MSKSTARTESALEQESYILRWVYTRYLPWTPLDPTYGSELSDAIAADVIERFKGDVHHRLLERVVWEIASRKWVPRDNELDWVLFGERSDFVEQQLRSQKIVQRAGDPLILEQLCASIAELSDRTAKLAELMGSAGHNSPTSKNDEWRVIPDSVRTIREIASSINASVSAHKRPSHSALLDSAKALHSEAKKNDRLGDVVDTGIDAFARSYGSQLGKNAAHATSAMFLAILPVVYLLLAYIASTFAPVASVLHDISLNESER